MTEESGPAIHLDAIPAPAPAVVSRLMENEAVVVLAERGQAKVLNEVGARIWALADGKLSVRQIIEAVCAEFNVTAADAEADTLAFLEQLRAQGAITISDAPTLSTP